LLDKGSGLTVELHHTLSLIAVFAKRRSTGPPSWEEQLCSFFSFEEMYAEAVSVKIASREKSS
jgi:hypothetical protein